MSAVRQVDCCVVGGGPAGMMAGYLFARTGLRTAVIEKHGDFLRDFRGDTVHPSTLEIFNELGLLERFLQRPHERMERIGVNFAGRRYQVADFGRLNATCRFIAFMPQWEFLDFLAGEAAHMPRFELLMNTRFDELIERSGQVRGVRATTPDGPIAVEANLVIGADGRSSRVRKEAGLGARNLGAPIDVLWFALPRASGAFDETLIHARPGAVLVTIDRGDYWQCAWVIRKGGSDELKSKGIAALRAAIADTAPSFSTAVEHLKSWDETSLLTVQLDRLERWSRPGLLIIGDAAHAMSPIGGVGINLAIQDAVAAANLVAPALREGPVSVERLEKVRRRRTWPTRATQFVQSQAQDRLLGPLLAGEGDERAPLPLRAVARFPFLQGLAARAIGIGARRERVRTVARFPLDEDQGGPHHPH